MTLLLLSTVTYDCDRLADQMQPDDFLALACCSAELSEEQKTTKQTHSNLGTSLTHCNTAVSQGCIIKKCLHRKQQ